MYTRLYFVLHDDGTYPDVGGDCASPFGEGAPGRVTVNVLDGIGRLGCVILGNLDHLIGAAVYGQATYSVHEDQGG